MEASWPQNRVGSIEVAGKTVTIKPESARARQLDHEFFDHAAEE
jgi:hypothetical protein